MRFHRPLIPGILLRRYKRFLADVRLEDGREVTAHSPNTGSMLGVSTPGSRIWLLHHDDPRRKTQYTWELTELKTGLCVGVNTARSNALVREVLEEGHLPELQGYPVIRQEVRYGQESSRIDLLLSGHPDKPDCYMEVKNVTAADEKAQALFPDAVTQRGQKHMRELMHIRSQGQRAAVVFTIQRTDTHCFRPAWEIDPAYSELLEKAARQGVEIYPLQFRPSPDAISFERRVPVCWSRP